MARLKAGFITSGPHSEALTEVTNSRRKPSSSVPSMKPLPERNGIFQKNHPRDNPLLKKAFLLREEEAVGVAQWG